MGATPCHSFVTIPFCENFKTMKLTLLRRLGRTLHFLTGVRLQALI